MGFATRGWYAAGRTVSAHLEPCVRGLAEWGGRKLETGTGRADASHCFVPTKFALRPR
jgi:hypothetical protein